MWALSTASSSVSAPGRKTAPAAGQRRHELEVDLLVVERHDAAAGGEGPQVARRRRAIRPPPRPPRRRRHRRGVRPARPRTGRARWPPRPPYAPADQHRRTRSCGCSGRSPPSGDSPRQWGGHSGQTTRGAPGTWPKPLRIGSMIDDRRAAARHRGPAAALRAKPGWTTPSRPDLRARCADPPGGGRLPGTRHRPGHRRGAGVPAPPHDAGPAGPHRAVGHGQPAPARHRAVPPGRGGEHVGHELRAAGRVHEGVPGVADAPAARRGGAAARGSGSPPTPSPRSTSASVDGAARAGRRPGRHHAQAGGHRRRRHRHLDDRHGDHRRSHRPDHHRGGRGGGPPGATGGGVAADRRHATTSTAAKERINAELRHLPEPALVQGHAGQGGCRGGGRHRLHRGRGGGGGLHLASWPTPAPPTSWPPSWATTSSADAASP